MSQGSREELHERARTIELLVLDVDGVLTDGGLYYGSGGELMKRFDVKDGHGIVLARHAGLNTAILTGRSSAIVAARARELGIEPVLQGSRDKDFGLTALLKESGLTDNQIAYMGDDLNDLAPLSRARLALCPSDAHPEIRQRCHFVTHSPGGHGAVREAIELILIAQGRWNPAPDRMQS